MYRSEQCTAGPTICQFISECDKHYDEVTGEWDYPDPLKDRFSIKLKKKRAITENELRPGEKSVLTRIRNGKQESDKSTYRDILEKDKKIEGYILSLIDKDGGVYSDDLVRETGFTRECITRHLRRVGFVKTNGATSKRWEKVVV